jgi:hypothetical protein
MKLLSLILVGLFIHTPSFANEWEDKDGEIEWGDSTSKKTEKKSDDEINVEGCEPTIMNFVTEDSEEEQVSGSTVLLCNGAYYALQDTTTVHMMTEKGGMVCYADYSCGNMDAWEGYFSISGETFYGALGAFLKGPGIEAARRWSSYSTSGNSIPDLKIGAILSFGKAHLERSCTEISDKVCFSK